MSGWHVLCTGTTVEGRRCRAHAIMGSDRCVNHGGRERKVPPAERPALRQRLRDERTAQVLAEWSAPDAQSLADAFAEEWDRGV